MIVETGRAHRVPKINVAFDVDANGILNVTASDSATGKVWRCRLPLSSPC